MIRTQVYLTETEKEELDIEARALGVSKSDLIRQAVDELLARSGSVDKAEILDGIAGIWSGRDDIPDVRDLRRGWRGRPAR